MQIEVMPNQRQLVTATDQRWLAICLVVGLIVRLGWTLHLPADDRSLSALPDQLEYLHLAQHALTTGTLSFFDARFNQDLFAYRTPGYPALIAICCGSIRAVRVLQAVIDTGSILAVYLLARCWLREPIALLAAWIVCVNPWVIYFTGLLLGETLFAATLIWGMYLLTGRKWWIGAILLIAGVYVRPSSAFLPAALTVLSPRSGSRSNSGEPERRRSRSGRAAIVLVLTLVALLPWALRNHARLDRWIWLTTNGGITLYDGFNPTADGSSNQSFIHAMPQLTSMTEVQRNDYFQHQSVTFIKNNPATTIKLVAIKILRTWSPIPLSESYKSDARAVIAGGAYAIPLFVCALVGLYRGSLTWRQRVFLLGPAIYITIVHGLTIGSLRYRIPADVPLAIVAASAFNRAFNRAFAGALDGASTHSFRGASLEQAPADDR